MKFISADRWVRFATGENRWERCLVNPRFVEFVTKIDDEDRRRAQLGASEEAIEVWFHGSGGDPDCNAIILMGIAEFETRARMCGD